MSDFYTSKKNPLSKRLRLDSLKNQASALFTYTYRRVKATERMQKAKNKIHAYGKHKDFRNRVELGCGA
jgi:hypothetical protein